MGGLVGADLAEGAGPFRVPLFEAEGTPRGRVQPLLAHFAIGRAMDPGPNGLRAKDAAIRPNLKRERR